MDIMNKKLSNDEFYGIRKEILGQWSTGRDVDFDEAIEYHKNMPESKSFSRKLAAAKKRAQDPDPAKSRCGSDRRTYKTSSISSG